MTGDSFPALIQPTHLSVGEMGVQTGRGWLPEASAAGRIRGAYRPTDSFTVSDLLRGPLKLWGKSPEGRRGPEARHKAEQSVSRKDCPKGGGSPEAVLGQEGTMLHPLQGSCARETNCVFTPLVLLSPALGPFVFAPFLGKAVPRLPPARFSNSILILPGLGMGRWLCGTPGGKSLSNYGYRLPATKRTLSNQVHGHTVRVSKHF